MKPNIEDVAVVYMGVPTNKREAGLYKWSVNRTLGRLGVKVFVVVGQSSELTQAGPVLESSARIFYKDTMEEASDFIQKELLHIKWLLMLNIDETPLFSLGDIHTVTQKLSDHSVAAVVMSVYSFWDTNCDTVRVDSNWVRQEARLRKVGTPDSCSVQDIALSNLQLASHSFKTAEDRAAILFEEGKPSENMAIQVDHPQGFVLNNITTTMPIQAKRPTIALVTCMKNEEEQLPGFFARNNVFFDKIILIDNGSTDRSADIARELGATVVCMPFTSSFSALRNTGLKVAQKEGYDWVMQIDCDEVVDSLCNVSIYLHDPYVEAYVFNIRTYTQGADHKDLGERIRSKAVDYTGTSMRLFRCNERIGYKYKVHERITLYKSFRTIHDVQLTNIKKFKAPLADTLKSYWALLLDDTKRYTMDNYLWLCIGTHLKTSGYLEEAIVAFKTSLSLSPEGGPTVGVSGQLADTYELLAMSYKGQSESIDAVCIPHIERKDVDTICKLAFDMLHRSAKIDTSQKLWKPPGIRSN